MNFSASKYTLVAKVAGVENNVYECVYVGELCWIVSRICSELLVELL